MMRRLWTRVVVWIEQWMQPLAFASGVYLPTQAAQPPPDLNDQLEEILACVRQEELKWEIWDRIRNASKRHFRDK